MQVKDIMHKDVVTIDVGATIEEAALAMSIAVTSAVPKDWKPVLSWPFSATS